MWGGYDAARWSPDRPIPWWPTLNPRYELDDGDLYHLWLLARYLHANSADVRHAVLTICNLLGCITPLPQTEDAEWNDLARAAFWRRVQDPRRLDAGGRLNWRAAQTWLETRAVVDGDALTVLTRGHDGGARLAFYAAPSLTYSGGDVLCGVELDELGGAVAYHLTPPEGEPVRIDARQAVLYMQHPDPSRPRGASELAAALTDVQDIKDIQGFLKIAIKNAASFALFEEKPIEDKRAQQQSAWQARTAARNGTGEAGSTPAPTAPPVTPAASVDGVKMVSLAPGRKATLLHDTRPSTENQSFIKRLTQSLAHAVGLHASLMWVDDMNSASTRYLLQTLKAWRRERLVAREVWANTVYTHVIACEVASGRLRPCRDRAWQNVLWVGDQDMTIDRGREVAGEIDMLREGLADADAWTLATEGMTQQQVLRRRAANLAAARAIASEYNVPLAELLPGALGSTQPPASDQPDMVPLPDVEPEM